MALVKELEENGCQIKGSNICLFVRGEVQRCVNCEYKTFTDEQMEFMLVEHYKEKDLLDEYPVQLDIEEGKCGLCTKDAKDAVGTISCEMINSDMDVKQDLAGTGKILNGGGLDVDIDCCPDCAKNLVSLRRRHSLYAALAVILCLTLNAVANFLLFDQPSMLNLLVLGVSALLSYALYYYLSKKYYEKITSQTYVKLFDIPYMKDFKNRGWKIKEEYKFLSNFPSDKQVAELIKNSR